MAGSLSVLHSMRSAHENEVLQANHDQLETFMALASAADDKGLLATYVQHKAWTHTAEVERKRVELYMTEKATKGQTKRRRGKLSIEFPDQTKRNFCRLGRLKARPEPSPPH
jgi:hypothetical protein